MGEKSAIEWTDATWNPVTGCSKVSPGCAHCYAEALSLRMGWSSQPWTPEHAAENVILHSDRLDLPRRWKTPRRIFVNSMSDLFHERVPDGFIDGVFATMVDTPRHTYQVLTKRPERMRQYVRDYWPRLATYPHIWLGTSVENQHWADVRIPHLLHTSAAVRFLSCEPLLGPLDLQGCLHPATIVRCAWLLKRGLACPPTGQDTGIHWVITGGESGPNFRPFNPDWARAIRDQCVASQTPFLFKQHGGRTPKSGGRLLDGRTWDEYPEAVHAA